MISKEIFSQNLRSLMERDHLNQPELAAKLGVTKAAVNYWVNGRSVPQVSVVQRLADIFCCSTDDLLKEARPYIMADSPEDRLLFIFQSLTIEGQQYLLQQASIAAAMFGEKYQSDSSSKSG